MANGVIELGRNPGSFSVITPTSSTGIAAALIKPVRISGIAQATAATTITLAAGASATDSYYVGWKVQTKNSAAGPEQERTITAYVGSTKVATVAAWGTTPTSTTPYILIPPFEGLEAQEALITVAVQQVRFRVDGIAPTADVGHILASGGSYLLRGTTGVKNLRLIDTIAGASTVSVTLFF